MAGYDFSALIQHCPYRADNVTRHLKHPFNICTRCIQDVNVKSSHIFCSDVGCSVRLCPLAFTFSPETILPARRSRATTDVPAHAAKLVSRSSRPV